MSSYHVLPARQLLNQARERLCKAGVEATRQEVVWMLEKATGLPQAALLFSDVEAGPASIFEAFLIRRLAHEPVQYILGEAGFHGRTFAVNPSVLIPRPETEGVVERALEHIPPGKRVRVLDVGTGSGCIAISVAAERPHARVTALDISAEALETAVRNAGTHRVDVRFVRADVLAEEHIPGAPFDVVVSNPPYISLQEKVHLSAEVRDHEPEAALFTGTDPLVFYRRLALLSSTILKPGGWVVLETHADAAERVLDLLQQAAFTELRVDRDLAGMPRYVVGRS